STLSFEVTGPVATPQAAITVSVNGVDVTGSLVITGDDSHWFVSYDAVQAGDEVLIEATNADGTSTASFIYPQPVKAGNLLWADADAILRAGRDGSDPGALLIGLARAVGVAVDASTNEIYFADDGSGPGTGKIGRVNFD